MPEQQSRFLLRLAKMLHVQYSRFVEDPLPQQWGELIRALDQRDRLDQGQHTKDRDPRQRRLYERKLLVADRHIVEGERRAADQRARISRLRKNGHDTQEAKRLLHTFEEILREMFRHRTMIVQQIREGR